MHLWFIPAGFAVLFVAFMIGGLSREDPDNGVPLFLLAIYSALATVGTSVLWVLVWLFTRHV